MDSWLAWCLSGGRLHVTDATNASRTLLYDLHAGTWDDELLALFGVPAALLPEIFDTSGVVGESDADVLGAPVPLAGMVGDQQASLFGQACTARGMTKVTYGTGCFLLMHTGEAPVASPGGLLSTVAAQIGGRRTYALEGSVFIGGAAVQWLRDGLGVIGDAAEADELAAEVPDSGGVYFVPALAGMGAPWWEPRARGAILGLTRGSTAAHIARATLEGIAFQVTDLLGAVIADAGAEPPEVRVDGGAARSDLLLQFQADVLGVPVIRTAQTESTALGPRCWPAWPPACGPAPTRPPRSGGRAHLHARPGRRPRVAARRLGVGRHLRARHGGPRRLGGPPRARHGGPRRREVGRAAPHGQCRTCAGWRLCGTTSTGTSLRCSSS